MSRWRLWAARLGGLVGLGRPHDTQAPSWAVAGPPWLAPSRRRLEVDLQWLVAAIALTLAGVIPFGWRGALAAAAACLTGAAVFMIGVLIRQKLGFTALPETRLHAATLALLAGLALPVTTGVFIHPLAGAIVGLAAHFIGRSHRIRASPVALAMVVIWLLPAFSTIPGETPEGWRARLQPVDAVLTPEHVIGGDLIDASSHRPLVPWSRLDDAIDGVAARRTAAEVVVQAHLPAWLVEPDALRRHMVSGEAPPLEEIILGLTPGAIGGVNLVAVLMVGFLLMHARRAAWSIPLVGALTALLTFIMLPVRVDESWDIVLRPLAGMDFLVAVTLVSYALLPGPVWLILLVFAPMSAPMTRRGRLLYAILLGVGVIHTQWLIDGRLSPYLALLAVGLLAGVLDHLRYRPFTQPSPRPVVDATTSATPSDVKPPPSTPATPET